MKLVRQPIKPFTKKLFLSVLEQPTRTHTNTVFSNFWQLGFAAPSMLFLLSTTQNKQYFLLYVHGLNLGLVVTLDILRTEVLEAHGGGERRTDRVQVGSQSNGLQSQPPTFVHFIFFHNIYWLVSLSTALFGLIGQINKAT